MRPTHVEHPAPIPSSQSKCLTSRRTWPIAFALASLLIAGPATAVSVSILGVTTDSSGSDLAIGDSVTFDFGISNAGGPVYAVGISIYGYDRNVLEAIQVDTPASFLNDTVLPDGRSFGGFANHANPKTGRVLPPEIERIVREATPVRVGLFQGISLDPIGGDGSLDPGLDSGAIDGLTGAGYAHARVTFRLIGQGPTTLWIGSDPSQDTVILADGTLNTVPSLSYSIGVGSGMASSIRSALPVPEPSAALLIGLGLAGMARRPSKRD